MQNYSSQNSLKSQEIFFCDYMYFNTFILNDLFETMVCSRTLRMPRKIKATGNIFCDYKYFNIYSFVCKSETLVRC